MTMQDFLDDMEARAFAAFAESNPRLNHLAEQDSAGIATEAEEAEFLQLLDKANRQFFGDEYSFFSDDWEEYDPDDDPLQYESPIDLFGPWWE